MKKNISTNKIMALGLSIAMAAGQMALLTGCGSERVTGREEQIELIEPVGVAETCVAVEYRNMYSYSSYSSVCAPKVTEYALDTSSQFSAYEAMSGEEVKVGDAIIRGNTKSLDEQIKDIQKSLENTEKNHNKEVEKLNKALSEAKSEADYKADLYEKVLKEEPVKTDSMTDEDYEKLYAEWDKQRATAEADNASASLAYQRAQLNLTESQELYELDYSYQLDNLNRIKKNRDSQVLYAKMNGTIVATGYYNDGDWIGRGVNSVAIGDFSVKELHCDYINNGTINKAVEYYAIIDGERYDIEYVSIDSDEYDRIKDKNGVVYTTFILDDPEDKVETGAFATIVVVNDYRNNVLCVPKTAIGKDDIGSFVYTFDGSQYSTTYVKVGMSDGLYSEILSGLSEGDMVKSSYVLKTGENEATVSYGDISGSFEDKGYLYYTATQWVTNEIQYGTIYLDEICVSKYQQVEKGQVLVKLHVVADDIEIARQERALLRKEEYRQELVDADKDKAEADKVNTEMIEMVDEQIADLKELISTMKSDAATVEITSPVNGIITDVMTGKPGDLMWSGGKIANIADESQCFIIVEDSEGRLAYNNDAEVTYLDNQGKTKTTTGKVVTVGKTSLSADLALGVALIQVPTEAISEMAGSTRNNEGWWSRASYSVKVSIRNTKHVLLVPKKAVTESGGTVYVTVKDENGSYRRVSFIAGGSDGSNYWAADGLTEGMTVCWE